MKWGIENEDDNELKYRESFFMATFISFIIRPASFVRTGKASIMWSSSSCKLLNLYQVMIQIQKKIMGFVSSILYSASMQ
jgi:hypothetical protein